MSDAETYNGVFAHRSAQEMTWILTAGVSHLLQSDRWGVPEVWCGAHVAPEGEPENFVPCQRCVVTAVQESDFDSAVVRWWGAIRAGERSQEARLAARERFAQDE